MRGPLPHRSLSNPERAYRAAAAHWNTYRHRLAEIISVSQLAMVSDDFAQYWAEICELPIELVTAMVKQAQQQGFCAGDDPHLIAVALVSMLNQFCYTQLSGDGAEDRRRRRVHHDVGQHLLPHHLLRGTSPR